MIYNNITTSISCGSSVAAELSSLPRLAALLVNAKAVAFPNSLGNVVKLDKGIGLFSGDKSSGPIIVVASGGTRKYFALKSLNATVAKAVLTLLNCPISLLR
jgi:hypothetical protein